MASRPGVVEFLLFWLPAIHHITFEHHVVISNDVVFSTEFSRPNIESFKQLFEENIGCVHDATTPAGNDDDIIKIADDEDQEDEDSTRRRRLNEIIHEKTTVFF